MTELALSEDQAELAEVVRGLLERRADSAAVRAAMASPEGYDRDLWRLLCDQVGVAGLAVAEEHGGAGCSLVEATVVLEELGRALAPAPLLASVVLAEALGALDDVEARARLLPRLAAGEVGTLAWAGPSGLGLAEPVRAEGAGERWTLHGQVGLVLDGAAATVLVAAARTDDGTALLEIDPAAVVVRRDVAVDPTTRLATVVLDGTPATRLRGDATAALAHAHRVGVVATTALQVGCARRGLDMTVAHAKERVQFGRPIGSFQALKHRMAEMLLRVEVARSASWAAARSLAAGSADAGTLVPCAASYCGEALDHVAAETVQLHGGIAITWEHDAHLVLKRAHLLSQLFGAAHQHRALLTL